MAFRADKIRTFNGEKYERAGQHPVRRRQDIEPWARFQRLENNYKIRIVKEAGGYEAYMRKRK